jgi:hypothetical protein
MKIRTIKIISDKNNGNWEVIVCPVEEREREVHHPPSHLGFYHAPAGMALDIAVKRLIDCMIEKHKRTIKNLNSSIEKLKEIDIKKFKRSIKGVDK